MSKCTAWTEDKFKGLFCNGKGQIPTEHGVHSLPDSMIIIDA